MTNQWSKAVGSLRDAVTFVPTGWADPYTMLAKAYAGAGQPEEGSWASAMALLATKRTDEAISALKGLTTGPAAIDAKVGLGLAYELQGDPTSAADWYRQALAARPDDLNAQAGLSRVAPAPSSSASPQSSLDAPSPSAAGGN